MLVGISSKAGIKSCGRELFWDQGYLLRRMLYMGQYGLRAQPKLVLIYLHC